jgi:hypothetical protein
MREFFRKTSSTLVVPVVLCLSGCFGPSIEGKYKDADGMNIEFVKTGDLFIYPKGGQQMSGHWSKVDDDRVTIRFDGAGSLLMGAQACNFKFDGSDLVLSNCLLAGKLKRSV